MALYDGGEALAGHVHSRVPAQRLRILATRRPPLGCEQSGLRCHLRRRCQMQRLAFGAQTTEVCRVLWVTPYTSDLHTPRFDHHTAAHSAIRAG